ncbi:phenylalanine--tRNA ligase subunit beta [Chlamydia psittaci]|uniref:phenylalanine--tRNA ligase subunit beta n=1 Tax=Chlamydia psittaci TaxID=83554 RepID=UPI0001F3724F|nr:phenylalanine--tRNA ligase subunit beta [Chlamydia psittaci]AFS19147.1 phenylalanyl-tRNA synthetase, beta subunit [Chlamydia psittaci 84/55]EPJ15978.1 phenylalanine--tRNA ligase, beta subunit [Chlamydia psittaci 02DC18]EPJ17020.1 phenylalanine--tRNA ligase, beta subunit [Chlamydia psittaci 02DC22]EPJ19835.1 phenylalanine--tRNA ligase, beta subunit [Chlamydia psittaci 02DC23]EPJ20936.1 phenylalanine--tRNA ligase, beta subunit [Chlamydia psittaci 02DC21]EPJ24253.1 phenylalanine--tRNA ligase,
MRVSLSSLQRFFSSPLSIKQIIEACDHIGIETEIETLLSCSFSSIITAKIIKTLPHPNADRLVVATLFDGKQEHQVVCGAPNCRPDIIVPLALPGAKLHDHEGNPYTIKKSKLRGVESQGMCCGTDELGFSHLQKTERGLFEFPEGTPLGESACALLADTSIEFCLTPNLGHCASLLGLAREIAHVANVDLILPEEFSFAPLETIPKEHASHDQSICPIFCCVKISGVSSETSPQELQQALSQLKQKSINTIVDITNYIMLALGQPLHVYDAKTVDIDSLRAEKAKEKHYLKLLNNEEVLVPQGTAIICDKNHTVGLAGVMGSLDSSFNETTTDIILEAAYFLPKAIRASQTHIPLHSEAAYRFTRGSNPDNVLPSLYAAIHYIQKLFPNAKVSPIHVVGSVPQSPTLTLRTEMIERVLGATLSQSQVHEELVSLGFTVTSQDQGILSVHVPSYRHDIREEIDLVEEICRTQPWKIEKNKTPATYTPLYAFKREIVDFLAQSGLQQFFTCDLLDIETAALHRQETDYIALQGSKHATVLRDSLLPGLLKSTATNLNRQAPYVHAFELGTVYTKKGSQYQETQSLGIILSGAAEELSWVCHERALSFYSIKGWVERLFRHFHISSTAYTIRPSEHPNFHPYQQAEIYLHKHLLGRFGTLHPQLCKKAQIKHSVFFAELSVDSLLHTQKKAIPRYQPYPIYPSSFRDITLTVDESIPADSLRKKLLSFHSKWLESVSIISIYQNKNPTVQNKNVSLRLVFQDKERTLSNQEIEEEHERLLAMLNEQLDDTKGTIDS